jgi:polyisoprenyl-teichoic acid--peptidoglycan teichoic acid transferase
MKKMTMKIDSSAVSKGTLSGKQKDRSMKHKKNRSTVTEQIKKKRRRIAIGLFILGLALVGGYLFYRANYTLNIMGINTNPSGTLGNWILQKDPELKKDENNRTNALIVGIDTRPSNPGLQNTDTIIIASYDHTTNEGIMLSLPRDLWVEYPDNPGYFTKINGIYNYCEHQEEGTGLECLVSVTENITKLDMHYHGMVDIYGLVNVIDILDGVDVEVERAFTDYMFPSNMDTWEVVSFEEGLQHMDGETAMKYARSRHAQGPEGSDFSRARRQQRLIMAIKDKFLSTETLQNPLTIFEIAEELGDSITLSDISTEDVRAALALGEKADSSSIFTFVLDPTAGNWTLITEDPSAAYVLFPKAGEGNWTQVQDYIGEILENPGLYSEKSTIYVYNGGYGYNETYERYLELAGSYPYLPITFAGNTAVQTYTGNTVFNFNDKPHLAALNEMAGYFETDWESDIPEGLVNVYGEDIMIVLGAEPQPVTTEGTAGT